MGPHPLHFARRIKYRRVGQFPPWWRARDLKLCWQKKRLWTNFPSIDFFSRKDNPIARLNLDPVIELKANYISSPQEDVGALYNGHCLGMTIVGLKFSPWPKTFLSILCLPNCLLCRDWRGGGRFDSHACMQNHHHHPPLINPFQPFWHTLIMNNKPCCSSVFRGSMQASKDLLLWRCCWPNL